MNTAENEISRMEIETGKYQTVKTKEMIKARREIKPMIIHLANTIITTRFFIIVFISSLASSPLS